MTLDARSRSRTRLGLLAGLIALLAGALPLTPTVGAAPHGARGRPVAIDVSNTPASSTSPNLLQGTQATFSGTTGDWMGSDADLSWAAAPSITSTGSLVTTATATSWVQAWSATPPAGGTPTPAVPGAMYTGDATVQVSGTSASIGDALAFYNASAQLITVVWGQAISPGTTTWTTLPEVAGIAPSSTATIALGVIAWTAAAGQAFYVDSPVLTSPPANGAASVTGPLHTSGKRIIDANGNRVKFRGVMLDGLEDTGTLSETGVTEQALAEAKAWGANFVRVPLGEQFWLSSNCDYVPSYESTVDQVVNWITSLGMVALLDLHTNTVGGCEAGAEHNMADASQAPTFWSEVGQRYGNPSSPEYNPLVAFDLYNEPHNISDAIWLKGGTTTDLYSPNQTYLAAGMQHLYNAVRSTGSQNLVFISGNTWGNTVPPTLVNGTNIVYAAHVYTCPVVPTPACTNADPYNPSRILDHFLTVAQSRPVVVTEFGWPSQLDGTYNANVIAFARAQGWGWSTFAWQESQYPSKWDLTSAWLADGTAEPSPSGMPVLLAFSGEG